jgi:hypothetical protein
LPRALTQPETMALQYSNYSSSENKLKANMFENKTRMRKMLAHLTWSGVATKKCAQINIIYQAKNACKFASYKPFQKLKIRL